MINAAPSIAKLAVHSMAKASTASMI